MSTKYELKNTDKKLERCQFNNYLTTQPGFNKIISKVYISYIEKYEQNVMPFTTEY